MPTEKQIIRAVLITLVLLVLIIVDAGERTGVSYAGGAETPMRNPEDEPESSDEENDTREIPISPIENRFFVNDALRNDWFASVYKKLVEALNKEEWNAALSFYDDLVRFLSLSPESDYVMKDPVHEGIYRSARDALIETMSNLPYEGSKALADISDKLAEKVF